MLYIPLVETSLQFNLYRICNIPLVHPILKKSFRYSIKEEYLMIRSDAPYILFPMNTDILACKYQMVNFVILTLCYIQQILQVLAATPFSFKTKIG